MKSNQKVEFSAPEHAIPEGTEDGEDFVETCTFRVKEGGKKLCLVELGDIRMPGYDDKSDSKDRPSYRKLAQGIMGTGGDTIVMGSGNQMPNGGGGY